MTAGSRPNELKVYGEAAPDNHLTIWSAIGGLAILCVAVLVCQWLYWSGRAEVSSRDRAELRARVTDLSLEVAELKTEAKALRGAIGSIGRPTGGNGFPAGVIGEPPR